MQALRIAMLHRVGAPLVRTRQVTNQCQRRGNMVGPMPFDTYALVVRLENEGFTRGQAQAITNSLLEVIRGSIRNESKTLATRTELEKGLLKLEEAYKATKAELDLHKQASVRDWGTAVKDEAARRRQELDKLTTRLKEETDKLAANARLDMNLERARSKEELRLTEDRVMAEAKRIESLLVSHQQEMLKIKNDVFKSMLTLVMGAGGVAVGVARLAGAPPAPSRSQQPAADLDTGAGAGGTVVQLARAGVPNAME
jgi:prophage antirepressor-like protein